MKICTLNRWTLPAKDERGASGLAGVAGRYEQRDRNHLCRSVLKSLNYEALRDVTFWRVIRWHPNDEKVDEREASCTVRTTFLT